MHNPRQFEEMLSSAARPGRNIQEIIDLARTNQVRLRFVEADRLGLPAQLKHQGVVARQAAVVSALESCWLTQKLEPAVLCPDSWSSIPSRTHETWERFFVLPWRRDSVR